MPSWTMTWTFSFNRPRCGRWTSMSTSVQYFPLFFLLITTKRKPSIFTYTCTMNGENVPRADNHGYLGVTINPRLSWNLQGPFQGRSHSGPHQADTPCSWAAPQVKKSAYEALVRRTLEYATCAWSPYNNVDIQTIERIQQAAARFISGDYQRHSSITVMLNRLQWDTQGIRRHLQDATMFFKIYHHDHSHVNILLPPIIMAADNRTRCLHHHKLRVIPSACLVYHVYQILCEMSTRLEPTAPRSSTSRNYGSISDGHSAC